MTIPAGIVPAALANHLWQSTLFAIAAALVAVALRRNRAQTRYAVWLIASLKFFIPFSLLIAIGTHLQWPAAAPIAHPVISVAVQQIGQPFATSEVLSSAGVAAAAPSSTSVVPMVLTAVWLCGFVAVLLIWLRRWMRIRAIVRAATPLAADTPIKVLSSPSLLEPGVFGIFRPVLLLPAGITRHLEPAHVEAILAHELCHVRRRDNLAAAIHMLVEAIFWFHPLVWWIGARLVEERERACDEEVLQLGNRPQVYAESILKTCQFYLESPLVCVSGVTGSDLKKRILRIMTEQVAQKLNFRRKLLLSLAGLLAVAVPVAFGLAQATQGQDKTHDIAGTWQGTLHAGKDLRVVLKVDKADGGNWKAVFYSIDQGGQGIPVTSVTLQGSTVKFSIIGIDGSYEGKLSTDGSSITGTWTQGARPLPLILTRATEATAWAIPEAPKRLPPMAADANPEFEVATIKPSKPGIPGKGFRVRGRQFSTLNTSLNDLITFAYGVHVRQIVGGPPWLASDKYDIAAEPNGEGQPNDKQWKTMLQKLLADRFQLKFHRDKKELSAYALVVGKNGPKLTKSQGDPNGLPGLFFRQLGVLTVTNANMGDFAQLMQGAVLDRPVVDQTGLQGRFDFTLKWTPDESQFASFGVKIPPPSDSADAPPGLFTAIQEQLGLKLDATKAPVEVLVIDHVEKPSEN